MYQWSSAFQAIYTHVFETYQRYKVYEGFYKSKIVGKGTKRIIIDNTQCPTISLLGANKTSFHCDKTGNKLRSTA